MEWVYNHAGGSFVRKTSRCIAISTHGIESTPECSAWFGDQELFLCSRERMEARIKDVEAVGNPEHAKGVQINTMKTRIPEEVAISKEAALFILNRYTNVGKAERPTRNGEVEELWKLMSKMLSTQSDRTSWSKLKRT